MLAWSARRRQVSRSDAGDGRPGGGGLVGGHLNLAGGRAVIRAHLMGHLATDTVLGHETDPGRPVSDRPVGAGPRATTRPTGLWPPHSGPYACLRRPAGRRHRRTGRRPPGPSCRRRNPRPGHARRVDSDSARPTCSRRWRHARRTRAERPTVTVLQDAEARTSPDRLPHPVLRSGGASATSPAGTRRRSTQSTRRSPAPHGWATICGPPAASTPGRHRPRAWASRIAERDARLAEQIFDALDQKLESAHAVHNRAIAAQQRGDLVESLALMDDRDPAATPLSTSLPATWSSITRRPCSPPAWSARPGR